MPKWKNKLGMFWLFMQFGSWFMYNFDSYLVCKRYMFTKQCMSKLCRRKIQNKFMEKLQSV